MTNLQGTNWISRIKSLNENSTARWGKMNVYQMLKHCTTAEEMYLGRKKYNRILLGRLIGKMVLKNMLKDETPMPRNSPTSPHFIVKEHNGDVSAEKDKWIELIEDYKHFNGPIIHWFFGEMNKEEIGYFVYKHTDHHLRQFNS